MRRTFTAIALSLAAASLAAPASAATFVFAKSLAPEVMGATGSGSVKLIFDTTAHTLDITTDWSGLSGTTTVAHIHCCVASPGTAGVAVLPPTLPGFPVGVTSGSYSTVLDLTQAATYSGTFVTNFGGGTIAGAEAALLSALQGEMAYLNIHSTTFPSGEIRAFPSQIPEPESWALMLLGFGLVGLVARSRRRLAGEPAAG